MSDREKRKEKREREKGEEESFICLMCETSNSDIGCPCQKRATSPLALGQIERPI
jgi:hypothetical protein